MPKLPKHVYRRGSSFYLCLVVKGKRIRRSLGRDLTEARRLAPLLVSRYRELGEAPEPEPIRTVEAFADRWVAEHVAIRRNEKGQKLAVQRLKDHILPVIGGLDVTSVRTPDIRRLRANLDGKGLRPQTVHHILTDTRCLFRYAVECDEIDRSPVSGVVFPRLQEQPPKRLSDVEVLRVLRATPPKYRLAVELALETGLRWSELHRLTWGDVLQSGELRIHGTKSGSVRYVPLTPRAEEVLEQGRSQKEGAAGRSSLPGDGRAAPGLRISGSDPVLLHRGTNPDAFVRIIRRRSGVRFSFHQLRHTFACRFLESGGDREALRLMLGHSTLRMTHRYGAASRDWLRIQVRGKDSRDATEKTTREGGIA